MNDMNSFDGFAVNLIEEDNQNWVAHFVELPSVSAGGANPETALYALKEAWIAMKESYQKHNEPIPLTSSRKEYSGQFNVRIDRRLHKSLAMEAALAGVSLNALVAQKLIQATSSFYITAQKGNL